MTALSLRLALLGAGSILLAAPALAQGRVSYTKEIRPILERRCVTCHGVEQRGGLKLDSFENIRLGSEKGQVILPGQPDRSRLYTMVSTRMMPPGAATKLTRDEVSLIRRWIVEGANDDSEAAAGAGRELKLTEPKEGATVREKVRIAVPVGAIPPTGFVSILIDGSFRAALAPPSAEELEESKLPPDAPLVYTWDTRTPLLTTVGAREAGLPQDGPHVIEVRAYDGNGRETGRAQVHVTLQNAIQAASNQPVELYYVDIRVRRPEQLPAYVLRHTVNLEATAGPSLGGGFGGGSPAPTGGSDTFLHKETSDNLVSLESYDPVTGVSFWRELRQSPLIVTVNNQKHVVRWDNSSRYYSITSRGQLQGSRALARENRTPLINPLTLPGHRGADKRRLGESFTTDLRIHLGAYIQGWLNVEQVDAAVEGLEWQHGEQCVRLRLVYNAGNARVNIHSLKMYDVPFEIDTGTSTVWFSQDTKRVLKAVHEVTGSLVVDLGQAAGGGGGYPGSPGGDFGAGGGGGGGLSGGPGTLPAPPGFGGAPGPAGGPGSLPPPGGGASGGFGSPFSGGRGGPGGYSGGYPGGYPGAGGSGGYPGGYPGAGGSGGYPGGYPGAGGSGGYPGGYPGAGGSGGFQGSGGNTGLPGPTTKRYHVKLEVVTELNDAPPKVETASAR